MNETLLTWVVFILAFGGMVLIHEFGHFIAARMSGIDVDEFGVGLPTPGALTLWVNKGYLILKNGQRVEIPFNFRFPINPHDLNGRQVRLTVDQVNERLVLRSLEVMNVEAPRPSTNNPLEADHIYVDQAGRVANEQPAAPAPKVLKIGNRTGAMALDEGIKEMHLRHPLYVELAAAGWFCPPKGFIAVRRTTPTFGFAYSGGRSGAPRKAQRTSE